MADRELENALGSWLGLEEKPARAKSAKVDARKRELARLELKLWAQLNALTVTVRRIKSARRSLTALKRARRKAVRHG